MIQGAKFQRSLLALVIICFVLSFSVQAQNSNNAPNKVPNSFIVQVKEGVNPQVGAQALAQALAGRPGHVYTHALKGFSIFLPPGWTVADIEKFDWVKKAEPDLIMHAFSTYPTGVDRIDAEPSVVGTVDVSGIDVAVIDTGIDADHPDLNVVGGVRFSSNPVGKLRSDDKFDDDNGHGTHVAGTIGAKNDGANVNVDGVDVDVVGIVPGVNLWAVKVLDSNGSGYLSTIIAGVDWVTENAATIEVANMSLGGGGVSDSFRTAIQNSVAAGVVYVVAAGNDASDIYGSDGSFNTSDDIIPAAYPEVAAISALADSDGQPGGQGESWDDSFADFSNYSGSVIDGNPMNSTGAAIDLILPGVKILSTYFDGGYAYGDGTSMASPHGAGLAALYIAANGRANDSADVYAIRQALIDGGMAQDSTNGLATLNDPDGNLENLGWAGAGDMPPTVNITSPSDGATVAGTVSVNADASDDNGVTQVEFFVDDGSIGTDTDGSDGWSASWDTTTYADGSHSVSATATDTALQTSSDSVSVTIDNVDDPPTVSITNPVDGATVSGTVSVTADASDDNGVNQVEFFVDSVSIGVDSDSSDGWSASWDTTAYADEDHTVKAVATDTEIQTASDSISVTVDNTVSSNVHIGDLDGTSINNGRTWTAEVIVTVHDGSHNPVSSATVNVSWSIGNSDSKITNNDGQVTFSVSNIHKSNGSTTLTVNEVSHDDYSYDSSANHDPDGDSDGTSITVYKP